MCECRALFSTRCLSICSLCSNNSFCQLSIACKYILETVQIICFITSKAATKLQGFGFDASPGPSQISLVWCRDRGIRIPSNCENMSTTVKIHWSVCSFRIEATFSYVTVWKRWFQFRKIQKINEFLRLLTHEWHAIYYYYYHYY